jgi:tetratricopeptide (TPR) repeat protein
MTTRGSGQTIAALFASEHQLSESRAHLERARRIFPADPQILAASGRLHETFAAPGLQLFVDTGSPANDLSIIIGSTRSNLRQAQAYFSRLVELDAASAETRLHFGRVLGLQGRHDDAASELRRAAAAASDPLTQYYASLFLGVEEQALGQPDRARESFEAAPRSIRWRSRRIWRSASWRGARAIGPAPLTRFGSCSRCQPTTASARIPGGRTFQAAWMRRRGGCRRCARCCSSPRASVENDQSSPRCTHGRGPGDDPGAVPELLEPRRSRPRRCARDREGAGDSCPPDRGLRCSTTAPQQVDRQLRAGPAELVLVFDMSAASWASG